MGRLAGMQVQSPWAASLSRKTVVVTGAASGIGAAVATAAAQSGASVWWVDKDESVSSLAQLHGGHALVADVTADGLAERVLAEVLVATGRLDHFIAAAAVQRRSSAMALGRDDWQTLLEVNLSSVYTFARVFATELARSRPAGSIVVFSSISGTRTIPGIIPYGVVKAALSHLVRGLAVELGADGVRVNAVAPGYVETPMTSDVLSDEENRRRILSRLPMKRLGMPADMTGPTLFLLSDEARYVTGQILGVDGGFGLT
jgi:3-oxoacyl-[acyl-carrier protein] reductase